MQLEVRDRPTDRQTDITTYRAAIAAKTKMEIASKVVALYTTLLYQVCTRHIHKTRIWG